MNEEKKTANRWNEEKNECLNVKENENVRFFYTIEIHYQWKKILVTYY
jgi:hypothetical protein